MVKSNKDLLLRLDILEFGRYSRDYRYAKTKQIVNSMKRREVFPEKTEAEREIKVLKKEISERKIHYCIKTLSQALKKAKKVEQKKKNKEGQLKWSEEVIEKFDDSVMEVIAKGRIAKICDKVFGVSKENGFLPRWIEEAHDKENQFNGSRFHKQADEKSRNLISVFFSAKVVLQALLLIENSLRVIQGPVDKDEKKFEEYDNMVGGSDDDHESDADDDAESDKDGKKYDQMVAGSESESEREADDSGNESSDSLSDDRERGDIESTINKKEKKEKKEPKKESKNEKIVLPALQTGYYSGGSDSEIEDIAAEEKKVRKNRRGQRARQKIWEMKYGKAANHVKKENERVKSEREQKKADYEERVRKRALKQKQLEAQGKSMGPTNYEKRLQPIQKQEQNDDDKPMHPSWIAKRKAEEALAKVEFKGKKIKFD